MSQNIVPWRYYGTWWRLYSFFLDYSVGWSEQGNAGASCIDIFYIKPRLLVGLIIWEFFMLFAQQFLPLFCKEISYYVTGNYLLRNWIQYDCIERSLYWTVLVLNGPCIERSRGREFQSTAVRRKMIKLPYAWDQQGLLKTLILTNEILHTSKSLNFNLIPYQGSGMEVVAAFRCILKYDSFGF